MKICIVTVYNSINSGSFWQAKAMEIFLKKEGYDVVFLKRSNSGGSSSSKINMAKRVLKIFLKDGLNEAKRQCNIFRKFLEEQKQFEIIPNNLKNNFEDIDLFVLGSDTIWNLDNRFFLKNYKTFFGGRFKNKEVITYAASVGNTGIEKIKKYKDIPKMLEKLKDISVRDESTQKIVKELIDKDVSIVGDPTLLLDKEYYAKIEKNRMEKEGYIFLYLFLPLTDQKMMELKEFASKNNLKIINATSNSSLCDKCILNCPTTFLNYMLHAEYIITDTFHGTVFSINLNKQFVAINRNKKKVNNFLDRMNLKNKLISIDEKIGENLKKNIDYEEHNIILEEIRNNSKKYLRKNLI